MKALLGLGDRLDHYPVQLSGGMVQRVALARAFRVKPPILMADEPTGNLDSVNGAHVLDLLITLNQREGTTLVLVTHDIALADRADRIVTMRDGLIVADELRDRQALASAQIRRHEALTSNRRTHRLARDPFLGHQVSICRVRRGPSASVLWPASGCGFSDSVRAMPANSESRTIMAADLSARQFVPPKTDQIVKLDRLGSQGVDRTLITETVSMASVTTPDATPVLVSIKAVDPAKYPYYGTVKLSPEIQLSEALTPDTVIAGEDVLIRLGVKVGEHVHLGSADFTMAAIVLSEPDRMSGSLNVGLRMMISREGFERTGLMQLGSRAAERYLFKIEPNGPSMDDVRVAILDALPEARVIDSRESNPLITRGLDQATTFLSLISLIALIVGAIGVAMAMYAHLQQKMDNIAVMKSLGATSAEIIRIYTIQTLMLGLLGGIGGVLLGRVVEEVFPSSSSTRSSRSKRPPAGTSMPRFRAFRSACSQRFCSPCRRWWRSAKSVRRLSCGAAWRIRNSPYADGSPPRVKQ